VTIMTVERNIDAIVAELSPPPGRNPEHDLAQLLSAFLKKAQNGEFEPWIAECGDLLDNEVCSMIGLSLEGDQTTEEYWSERAVHDAYASQLWDALPGYLEWALDAAAHHRTVQLCERAP